MAFQDLIQRLYHFWAANQLMEPVSSHSIRSAEGGTHIRNAGLSRTGLIDGMGTSKSESEIIRLMISAKFH